MNPALLIVDVQQGFDEPAWGPRNHPNAEDRIATLLDFWHSQDWAVIAIQHASRQPSSPLAPDRPGYALKPQVRLREGDVRFVKSVNSAFIGTPLESWLHEASIGTVVVTGLTTVHCCSTTIRMGANLGFDMVAVDDAMATFDLPDPQGGTIPAADAHRVELAALSGEFARVVRTFELLETLRTHQTVRSRSGRVGEFAVSCHSSHPTTG